MDPETPKKSNLYTRTGDSGTTSLVGGTRIAKNSVRLEAYGTVDELNSWLGMVAADPQCSPLAKSQLQALMSMMFNLGSYLATPDCADASAYGIDDATVKALEGAIDILDAEIPPMKCFVLPGGTEGAAKAHVARTVCRRAERRILDLSATTDIDPRALTLVNRLSDYLFALARHINTQAGIGDIPWDKSAKL